MNINKSIVSYSSIVEIGEQVLKLEKETEENYLKLHRGVMDVETIDLSFVSKTIDFNQKRLQQYGSNDGDVQLIKTIKEKLHLEEHSIIITPGGMAALDLVINSLSDTIFWIPKFHWGSWNKVLNTHNKTIRTFDDFDITSFKPLHGVIMLCYPSNPTGYCPSLEELKIFLTHCKENDITVILDIPYYHLFNQFDNKIFELYYDNVIILSSFSKSTGLSGFRVGYVATKNKELYETMHIRSLYKYNSISTIPQIIINQLLTTEEGQRALTTYQQATTLDIKKNIEYLHKNNLLFDDYLTHTIPVGPFAIINKTFDELMNYNMSSVPLNKFMLKEELGYKELSNYSRVSVAVKHELFVKHFNQLLNIK